MINLGNIEIADLRLGACQVKALYLGSEQEWSGGGPTPPGPTPTDGPLCFTAKEANSTVRLDKVYSPDTIYLETSTDGSIWTDYSWTDTTGDTLTLANVGDKVYMRAKTENQTVSNSSDYYQFIMTGKIAASGNIQTLLKADGSRTDAPDYCYQYMFYECSSLTTAPALPATTLAEGCYLGIFCDCTSLTSTPALPATTLADSCYQEMFSGCTSLTTAPELPATTLANSCYNTMFYGCTSLTAAPVLPATTLAYWCYSSMFYECSSLSSVEVAFTTWTSGATDNWLDSVAASGTFTCPSTLPDTRGTGNIPEGWTKVDAA